MRRLLSILMLLLFVGYYSSITLFPHAHKDGDKVVYHSHPYSGTSSHSQHSHSAQSLQTIFLLSAFIAVIASAVGFNWLKLNGQTIVRTFIHGCKTSLTAICVSDRAPPVSQETI